MALKHRNCFCQIFGRITAEIVRQKHYSVVHWALRSPLCHCWYGGPVLSLSHLNQCQPNPPVRPPAPSCTKQRSKRGFRGMARHGQAGRQAEGTAKRESRVRHFALALSRERGRGAISLSHLVYSRYSLVRYRIRREIGYNTVLSVCMCVCGKSIKARNRL